MPSVVSGPIQGFAPTVVRRRAAAPVRLGKRCVDVLASLLLLLLLAPVMALTAAAVKLTSPGPVLFRQRRIGRNGRPFRILKFRSMRVDAEDVLAQDARLAELYLATDHKIPIGADPRVTPVGRFIRAWSIDELPQLFNVLAGHMSLVGPRPVTEPELVRYEERSRQYLAMRPGLTGLWQVSGRSTVKFPARADIDARYTTRCSPLLDFTILAKTPAAVLRRRGAD